MIGIRCLSSWFVVYAITTTVAAAGPEFQLKLRNGAKETIRQFALRDGTIASRDLDAAVSLTEVISLRRADFQDDWTERTVVLWLANGDRIVGEPVEITEDAVKVRWLQFPASDSLTIPLEYVAAISLQTPASLAGRQRLFQQLTNVADRGDVAWLASADRIAGEFTGFDRGEFHFTTDAGKLPIAKSKLLALRFDPELIAKVQQPKTRYLLSFTDGSRLTASDVQTDEKMIQLTLAFGAATALPADELVSMQVFSPLTESLSQREPESSQFTPYLAGQWTWAKDRNVLQGPLQVRGQEFAHGLGVHSQMTLAYALDSQDREFRATVGIDDAAEGKGHVRFAIALDGKPVWESPAVTGQSPLLDVPPINLSGAKRLELTVDFGEFGDVRDYANWCEPIILRDE